MLSRDEIIAMAREAGGFEDRDDGVPYCMWLFTPQELERFATSVIAKEREECAQLCEAKKPKYRWAQCSQYQAGQYEMAEYLVEAIRARNAA